MGSKKLVESIKNTARHQSPVNIKETLTANESTLFLKTKDLVSRGSTKDGKVVLRPLGSYYSKFKPFGVSRHERSMNLLKVAKELHRSMDELIASHFNLCAAESSPEVESLIKRANQ